MAKVAIVGTSHISPKSVIEISHKFKEFNPDIVCVELDMERLRSLNSEKKQPFSFSMIKQIGIKGTLFVLFGSTVQSYLSKKTGSKPGHDMLTAVHLAKNHEKKVALIDQPIRITLARFSKFFKKREIFGAIWDTIRSVFGYRPFEMTKIDLHSVPTDSQLKTIVDYMKLRFPSAHQVLLHERNIYMVNKLKKIVGENPEATILVVVGAAHKQGMIELLKK